MDVVKKKVTAVVTTAQLAKLIRERAARLRRLSKQETPQSAQADRVRTQSKS